MRSHLPFPDALVPTRRHRVAVIVLSPRLSSSRLPRLPLGTIFLHSSRNILRYIAGKDLEKLGSLGP
jgi:hypothetical protein